MATATIHASCVSDSPNSAWIGIPRTPNISQTPNISVNDKVDSTRTRVAPPLESAATCSRSSAAVWAENGLLRNTTANQPAGLNNSLVQGGSELSLEEMIKQTRVPGLVNTATTSVGCQWLAGGSILGLMMLGAAKGDSIEIVVTGAECEAALAKPAGLVVDGFGED